MGAPRLSRGRVAPNLKRIFVEIPIAFQNLEIVLNPTLDLGVDGALNSCWKIKTFHVA